MERLVSVRIVVTIETTKRTRVDNYTLAEDESVNDLFERAKVVAETRIESM